jgi:hypothetical protein
MTGGKSRYEQIFERIGAHRDELYASGGAASDAQSRRDIAPMYHLLGQIDEAYTDLELIGTGGMKRVYRAYDAYGARFVALARPAEGMDIADYDAFLREAHLTASLDHPGIIKIFNMGIDKEGLPFFTMELKKGKSLREMLRAARSPDGEPDFGLRRRIEIFLRVCEAVAYAHSRRILHLDLKPDNIQIGVFGEVQVCDWGMGVVKPRADDQLDTVEALLDPDIYGPTLLETRGTPEYIAPEQMRAREPKSEQMDIYALGRMLKELATLARPGTPLAAKDYPNHALEAVTEKASHPDPGQRYSSVADLREDIAAYLAGYAPSAERAGPLHKALLFYRRNRTPCNVAIAALALLGLSGKLFLDELSERKILADLAYQQALHARQRAEQEQLRAEQATANHLVAKRQAEEQLARLADMIQSMSYEMTEKTYIDAGIIPHQARLATRNLERIIEQAPPADSRVWMELFWLRFIMQQFDRALAVDSDNHELANVRDLTPLASEYTGKINSKGYLPVEDFTDLLRKLYLVIEDREYMVARMLEYDRSFPRSPGERSALIEGVLRFINEGKEDISLRYDAGTDCFRLSGRDIVNLHILDRYCVLQYLSPMRLDISRSGISELKQIRNLKLNELDLRGTPVSRLAPLRDMKTLQRLIVAPRQFSRSQLASLPAHTKVVVRQR